MLRRGIEYLSRLLLLKRDPVTFARRAGVLMGDNCRLINLDADTFGSEPYLIKIGNNVTISGPTRFVTHDGGVHVLHARDATIDVVAPIIIGDNVFVGINVVFMPGVVVGDNCVIGAGSIVTRDIPRESVAVGVPARAIKTLDEYWDKAQAVGFHIHTMPPAEKEAFLRSHFADRMENACAETI